MKETAVIVRICLNQKINFDPDIDDTGREWWYVSPLYGPMDSMGEVQQERILTVKELMDDIQALSLKSIKELGTFNLFNRKVIQIRGNRSDIIKECELIINK